MEENIQDLIKKHPAGYVYTPPNLDEMPNLRLAAKKAILPRQLDERHRLPKLFNQKSEPICAAAAAKHFTEMILWRKTDYPVSVDAHKIYARAKQIDGMGGGEGTSLTAALQATMDLGYFNPKVCHVGVLQSPMEVYYGIMRFGAVLIGCNITESWYYCNPKNSTIDGKHGHTGAVGGHAILAVGFDADYNIIIANSWGCSQDTGGEWGMYGTALLEKSEFEKEFMYGAVLCNCLNDFSIGIRV